jgi:hypothetical protein
MGNCNCVQDRQNNLELNGEIKTKSKSQNKYGFHPSLTEVYESTNIKAYNNADNKENEDNFKLDKYQANSPDQELMVVKQSKVSRTNETPRAKRDVNENGQAQENESVRPEVVLVEQETAEEDDFDYAGLAKEIFNIFNRVRLNPSKFLSKTATSYSKYYFINN